MTPVEIVVALVAFALMTFVVVRMTFVGRRKSDLSLLIPATLLIPASMIYADMTHDRGFRIYWPLEGRVMAGHTSAAAKLDLANAAMRNRDYVGARELFREAERLGASPLTTASGAAECSCRMDPPDYAAALADCNRLFIDPRTRGKGHEIRAMVFRGQGRESAFRDEIEAGTRAGSRLCGIVLASLNAGGSE